MRIDIILQLSIPMPDAGRRMCRAAYHGCFNWCHSFMCRCGSSSPWSRLTKLKPGTTLWMHLSMTPTCGRACEMSTSEVSPKEEAIESSIRLDMSHESAWKLFMDDFQEHGTDAHTGQHRCPSGWESVPVVTCVIYILLLVIAVACS